MSIDVGNGNSSRYHSVSTSPDFDFPDDNWAWIVVAAANRNGTEYLVSVDGSWGVIGSMNLYAYSSASGWTSRVSNGAEMSTIGASPAPDEPVLLCVKRYNDNLYSYVIGLDGSNIFSERAGPALTTGFTNSNGLDLARRIDGNSARYFDGMWHQALYVPGAAITSTELRQIAGGEPLESFDWYKRCVFHAAPLSADDPTLTDLTGRHVLTRNGTGYGIREQDDTGIKLYKPRDLRRIYRPIYSAVPAQELTPSLYTNTNTFYTHTVSAGSADQTLSPSLYTNANTFYAHIVSAGSGDQTLLPALYANPNTFYTHAISVGSGDQTLTPSLYQNQNTFYAHTVSVGAGVGPQTLTPSLYANQNIFWSPTVSGGIVQPTEAAVSGLTMLYDNHIKDATLTATSTGAGFDVDNLKNNNKSEIWRSANLSDQVITASLSSVKTISGVSVAFSNLVQGSSFRVRVYATTGSSTPIYDSGFIAVGYSPEPPVGFDTIGYISFAYGGGNYISHTFAEQMGAKVDVTFRSASNPDGAIEVSSLIISQSLALVRGASYGVNVSYIDESDHVQTDSGATIVDIRPIRKEISFDVQNAPREDRLKLSAVYRRAGSRTPVFCSLNDGDSSYQDKEHLQIFGYLEQDGLTRVNYNLDSTSIKVTEI